MSTLRIKDAPLLPNVDGSEKIPTGGRGDYSVSVDQIKAFAQGGLPQKIEDHINDTENPHQVTKEQVGLGNVDNTSDVDKPISTATQEALDLKANQSTTYTKTEVDGSLGFKADKTYVDSRDLLKADKTYVDSALAGFSNGAAKFYPTLAAANADIANIAVKDKVEVGEVANGGTWYKATAGATSLTKSPYDPLTQAKDYFTQNNDARVFGAAVSNINYDTTARTLTFSNTCYVVSPASVYTISTPQVVNLATNTIFRIEFNTTTRGMRAVAYNAAKENSWLVCGFVTASTTGIITNDFAFRTNGVESSGFEVGRVLTNTHLTVNLDTDTGFLIFRANGRIVSNSRSVASPAVSVALPTTNGAYRVEYNAYSNTIEINLSSTAIKQGCVYIGSLVKATTSTTLYGIDLYSINGVQASSTSATSSNTGVLLGASSTDINFDFVAKTLTIADQKVRFLRNGKTTLLSGQTLDISTNTGAWHSIVVDLNNNLSLRQVTLPNNDGDFVVGQFRFNDQQISGIPYYSIQGKISREKSNLRTANFLVPFGNVESNYEQPELPAYNDLWSANNGDYNKFYALYDALVAAHPDYVKKTTLGSDALGNPIHQYQFSTPEVRTLNALSAKAKVVLITGIHGGEKAGMYNTYFALKEIIERWQEDDHLAALYWGVNFIVVPVANPSGYNANTRWNHNTVDIARNFAADWSTALENGGSAPFSEAETVILDAVMSNNRDAVYVCSHHNFGDNQSDFIWNASATYFSRALAKNLIIGQTIRAKKRYSWMPQANDYYIGYTDLGQPGGSEGRQAVDKYALNASTFEISSSFAWESGMPTYSSAVATIGVETFINWLLMNIKYAPQLYNTRINL